MTTTARIQAQCFECNCFFMARISRLREQSAQYQNRNYCARCLPKETT